MLEFKDVNLSLGDRQLFSNLSFMVNEGEVLRVCGACGKTSLLRAILGFLPINDGYITVDGEVIDTDSAAFFRTIISYLPQELMLDSYDRVSDLIENLSDLKCNKDGKYSKEALLDVWKSIGISPSVYDKKVDEVDITAVRIIVLTVFLALKKRIVLVDKPISDNEIALIKMIAEQGASVVFTGDWGENDNMIEKKITLN